MLSHVLWKICDTLWCFCHVTCYARFVSKGNFAPAIHDVSFLGNVSKQQNTQLARAALAWLIMQTVAVFIHNKCCKQSAIVYSLCSLCIFWMICSTIILKLLAKVPYHKKTTACQHGLEFQSFLYLWFHKMIILIYLTLISWIWQSLQA